MTASAISTSLQLRSLPICEKKNKNLYAYEKIHTEKLVPLSNISDIFQSHLPIKQYYSAPPHHTSAVAMIKWFRLERTLKII